VELKSAVIGLGETGRPLFEILSEYHDVDGIDLKDCKNPIPINYDIINICIPYNDKFVSIVQDYQDLFNQPLTIIHSTVPIGTTSKIKNAVHSPILGKHNRMKEDLKAYKKWIGGELADEARNYLQRAGIMCMTVATSEETEALKLMCLAKYGMSIAFAQYQKDICDTYGFPYDDVIDWDNNYNENVAPWLMRPILTPPGKRINGHCVIQNTKILNEQHPNKILEEILRYA
jgi:UDP-N-acetyl-D-mannosaminuronate dehydrogenase